jgi:hypothetical protein
MTERRRLIPEHRISGKALGRHVHHDERSKSFAVRDVTPSPLVLHKLWYRYLPVLDQGDVGACTGFAAAGMVGTLADLVARLSYRPGWPDVRRCSTSTVAKEAEGPDARHRDVGYNSYNPEQAPELSGAPLHAGAAGCIRRALVARGGCSSSCLLVERHEACEFFVDRRRAPVRTTPRPGQRPVHRVRARHRRRPATTPRCTPTASRGRGRRATAATTAWSARTRVGARPSRRQRRRPSGTSRRSLQSPTASASSHP